jgi:ceramide glucosyltransferase
MDALALSAAAAAFATGALAIHLLTTLSALRRCRVPRRRHPAFDHGPSVTVIRPVCGLDACEEMALRSTFALDYRHLEILFCCASREDPAVPFLQHLIAQHPKVNARMLIGEHRLSDNPKLNNIVKGWRAASHGWIVLVDSNVLMPGDFVQRLLATWQDDTGLVCAPPIGSRPQSVWAELECAFLNTYQARWQYAADSAGLGFAQGKVMLWRRSDLEWAGGIRMLATEPAEDAAATRIVRARGLVVRLADGAFEQPLGVRTASQVWSRQVRWARLRRSTFPVYWALEALSGLMLPLLAAVVAAIGFERDPVLWGALLTFTWLASEAVLAAGVGWHVSWRSPLLWLTRELLLPVLWLCAALGREFTWRGTAMSVPPAGLGVRLERP